MSRIIVSAHQPNFLPYLGFFDKMQKSDIFVIRDEVLFTNKDFHHRNRIRINGNDNLNNPQFKWLTIPVEKIHDNIMHVPIKKNFKIKNTPWNQKIFNDIKASYQGLDYFEEYYFEIKKIINNNDEKLIDLNMKIINFLKNAFCINTKIIMASELGLKPLHYEESDASEDLLNICKKLNADVYLSGDGGKGYLNLPVFEQGEVKVEFQNFKHPVYRQKFPGFIPYMAALDTLFCIGELPFSEPEKVLLKT